MFEVDKIIPGALPKGDWSYTYRDKVLPLIEEEKFRHFYSENAGHPNASIRIMISLLIFMGTEKLTWRAVEFQYPRRLDWMNATNTPLGEAFIDHTTIFKFYRRLETDDTARELFTEITDRFMKLCGTSFSMQRTDSFYIHGWLKTLTRYGLFKETIRKFLQSLRKQKPGIYTNIKSSLSQPYLDNDFDITEKDQELAHRKVALMARDLYQLKYAFEHHKQIQHYATFKTLATVFNQQCEVKQQVDSEPEIIIKDKPDKDAICTPHNPDARFVRKGKQRVTGDKGVITQTCNPENKTQFFTDADSVKATQHDTKLQPKVQDRLIKNNFKPDDHFEDAGFVNGQTILESQEKNINLEGPTAGRSQSFEAYNDQDRPFDAGDFDTTFNEHADELIVNKCPNNQVAKDQKRSEKTGKILVHFDPIICGACPSKDRCPVKIGKRVATYTVDKAEYVGAVRHHKYMSDSGYRKKCAIRAGVEAAVSELTRAHGVRRSRHRKPDRTKLQLIFAVFACNVKRFIRHGEQYAYEELNPQPIG